VLDRTQKWEAKLIVTGFFSLALCTKDTWWGKDQESCIFPYLNVLLIWVGKLKSAVSDSDALFSWKVSTVITLT